MSNLVAQLVEKSIERLNVNATVVAAWTGNGLTIVFNAADGEVTISGTEWQKALDRLPMAVTSMLRIAEQNAADSPTPNVPVLYPVLSSDVDVPEDTADMLFDVWSYTWEQLDGNDTKTESPSTEKTVSTMSAEEAVDAAVSERTVSGDATTDDSIPDESIVDDTEASDEPSDLSVDADSDAGDLF